MSCTTGRTIKAMTIPSTGGSHTEFLKKLASRCLCSQVMVSPLLQWSQVRILDWKNGKMNRPLALI
jgi:hypothetical protein